MSNLPLPANDAEYTIQYNVNYPGLVYQEAQLIPFWTCSDPTYGKWQRQMATANGVRTATNVVMPPSPYGLGPSRHYIEAYWAGAFLAFVPGAGLGTHRNSSTVPPGVVLVPEVKPGLPPRGYWYCRWDGCFFLLFSIPRQRQVQFYNGDRLMYSKSQQQGPGGNRTHNSGLGVWDHNHYTKLLKSYYAQIQHIHWYTCTEDVASEHLAIW